MAEALATAFTDNLLTCSICLGEYEDPRVLPCYHTFCFGCISGYASKTISREWTFYCPLCKERIQLPREGLVRLRKDFRVHKTKEILSQRQQHEVSTTIRETNVTSVTQAIAQGAICCEKHPNNESKYYCEDDDTVICCECILTEHSGHRISSIEQTAKCNRDKIKFALVKARKRFNYIEEAVIKGQTVVMGTVNESSDSQIRAATIECIKKEVQSMCKLIYQREETLISEVNSAYDERKKQNEANKYILDLHHASLQSACDFAQELIINGTDLNIIVHAKSLTERLAAMNKTLFSSLNTPALILYSPGKISTADLKTMLGQVTVQSQLTLGPAPVFLNKAECVHSFSSKLKHDKAMCISGLAIDEQHVFVVDKGNGTTKIFTHAGKFKFEIRQNNPFDVAVSQTGHLYITSQGDKCVQVYSTRGQQLTTMGQSHLKDPRGITLNGQGHVMVCDRGEKVIFTFYADSGQLLNTIPLSMCVCPQYITVNSVNDNIVISDILSKCVHVLSSTGTGDHLYQYGTEGSGDGLLRSVDTVCTDSYGHIFISDFLNHKVVALSPQGQFIRCIATKDDGMEHPIALAINPAGQLVVAERYGKVKTFQYLQ
ncbi:tripartite motif-containing protein 2-like isoform X2 [Lingula anatina]|uniref:Tripartite motif-containing protein 2-like isoform X2 n=1 Tax=Lingula anatina TaxID=7574 RepID=A0A2R2MKM7_LINAN|nr:tripartite motif-containing protein 2-like isoform X2 [Lingula anatina]|eukprot:XP_023930760.1 tripartite motif-containing protein 2-like isoform X2 [Lingula anatina]